MKSYKGRGIVLHTLKYGDSSMVAYLLTDIGGRRSYMVQGVRSRSGRGSKLALFQPMDKLDFFHSTEINEREKSRYYCYVGRLSEEKGVRMLLEVAESLPFPLYIAGDGPLLNELQAKYSSGNVIFLGHLSSMEIVRLVKHAQTMVVPSIWYENNPLSVIESLCMGTPVIGAEVGGIPELIREGDGMLFRMGDKEELASAIVSVMSKDNVDTQGIARRAQKRFSEERYWAELRNVYDL